MTSTQPTRQAVGDDPTLGALVHDLTEQMSTLVRDEMRLAQAEMTEKGKKAGLGLGMFGAAGFFAFFGFAALVTCAILLIGLVLPYWASALIVAGVLFLVAGIAAMVGKSEVSSAGPMKPEEALEGLKEDVATVKGSHRA
ncbi:MAG: phage holin family protein [Nocardioidaceae bacterium]